VLVLAVWTLRTSGGLASRRRSDRSAAGKALAESLGGTQEAFYWMQ